MTVRAPASHHADAPSWMCVLALLALALPTAQAVAADEPTKAEPPAVRVVAPLAVVSGEKVTVRLRGVRLSEATAVKITGPGADAIKLELKNKGKADGDDAVKKQLGDTQVEAELTLPADVTPTDQTALIVTTPQGDTAPTPLHILAADQLVSEAEPNPGLRQAQSITADRCLLRGAINDERDVDVYRIPAKAGQTLRATITAASRGSMLDGALTIYNRQGQVLAAADDDAAKSSRDPSLDFTFPTDGDYFLAVTDANDRGGAGTHPYLLAISKS